MLIKQLKLSILAGRLIESVTSMYYLTYLQQTVICSSLFIYNNVDFYVIILRRAPSIYVNIFSGEATIQFPTATQMARGGVCFLNTLNHHFNTSLSL